eukprot:comp21809_c0_seq2/m.49066 comp21809_c0_seq2/g.49066  ORF comp21809_c0_seq2/g.49066 comp21809_c0_seq2/m.49066 type:complete len:360 (+) comp21809_c0_seq2:591-1670(+)
MACFLDAEAIVPQKRLRHAFVDPLLRHQKRLIAVLRRLEGVECRSRQRLFLGFVVWRSLAAGQGCRCTGLEPEIFVANHMKVFAQIPIDARKQCRRAVVACVSMVLVLLCCIIVIVIVIALGHHEARLLIELLGIVHRRAVDNVPEMVAALVVGSKYFLVDAALDPVPCCGGVELAEVFVDVLEIRDIWRKLLDAGLVLQRSNIVIARFLALLGLKVHSSKIQIHAVDNLLVLLRALLLRAAAECRSEHRDPLAESLRDQHKVALCCTRVHALGKVLLGQLKQLFGHALAALVAPSVEQKHNIGMRHDREVGRRSKVGVVADRIAHVLIGINIVALARVYQPDIVVRLEPACKESMTMT